MIQARGGDASAAELPSVSRPSQGALAQYVKPKAGVSVVDGERETCSTSWGPIYHGDRAGNRVTCVGTFGLPKGHADSLLSGQHEILNAGLQSIKVIMLLTSVPDTKQAAHALIHT